MEVKEKNKMKSEHTVHIEHSMEEEKIRTLEERRDTGSKAAATGALVWGAAYSTAASGAAYLLGDGASFGDLFVNSLAIFPVAGAARGYLMWKVRHKDEARERVSHSKAA
jgi:hypothetical protein